MYACRGPTACMRTRLSAVRLHTRKFHFDSRNVARRLQDNVWWLVLPAGLLSAGYGYYKRRHQLWTIPSVSLNAANQPSGQDEFSVTVAGNRNGNMDLKRDAGEWMQNKDIGISNTRRAVVFSIGIGGKRSRDFYITS